MRMLATARIESRKGVEGFVVSCFAESAGLSRKSGQTGGKPPAELGPNSRLIGYARVSTPDQDVGMQLAALRRAGVQEDNLWFETISGVKAKRPQRDLALIDARPGDVVVVYKLDRLGRSFRELLEIVDGLEKQNIGFRSITEGFDTTTPGGKFMFHMLGAMAEFERGLIAERTRDGMAEAKAQGKQVGAPLFMTAERTAEAEKRLIDGETIAELAEEWGIARQTLYTRFPKGKIKRLRARAARGK